MQKELLILRHGKSDWSSSCDDFQRPLKNRGKRDAQHLGLWLQQQNLIPDFILSSPAQRAIATTEQICHTLGIHQQQILTDESLYLASLETLKKILNACPEQAQRVMIVGHNFGLEELVLDLSAKKVRISDDGKILPTATLAHFQFKSSWQNLSSHSAQLQQIVKGALLGKEFPYIGLQGGELRPYPSYHYIQSGVIPYCLLENQLKLLLIANEAGVWQLPKHILYPNLTFKTAAEQGAWEQAGLKGVVGDEVLGYHAYSQEHGKYYVSFYPMAVTSIQAEEEWDNSYQRQWFTPEQAIEKLAQPNLTALIEKLLFALKPFLESLKK